MIHLKRNMCLFTQIVIYMKTTSINITKMKIIHFIT